MEILTAEGKFYKNKYTTRWSDQMKTITGFCFQYASHRVRDSKAWAAKVAQLT